jgi:serine/threonine protein kinase
MQKKSTKNPVNTCKVVISCTNYNKMKELISKELDIKNKDYTLLNKLENGIEALYNSKNDTNNFLVIFITKFNNKKRTLTFIQPKTHKTPKTGKNSFLDKDICTVTDYLYNLLKKGKGVTDIKSINCAVDKACLKYTEYNYYDISNNLCCADKKYKSCTKDIITHEIADYSKKADMTQNYKENKFDSSGDYKGEKLIIDHLIYSDNLTIPFYESFTHNGLIYRINTLLGSGGFGMVIQYIYQNKDQPPKYFAVKYGDIKNEQTAIDYMQKTPNRCSELLVKYIIYTNPIGTDICRRTKNNEIYECKKYTDLNYFNKLEKNKQGQIINYTCIIMENAEGTIDNLIPIIKQNKDILVQILYAIVIAIKCLFDIGLYYIDIKPQNILYQHTKNGYKIILGDLGGAVLINDIPGPTYPPYEYCVRHSTDLHEIITIYSILIPPRSPSPLLLKSLITPTQYTLSPESVNIYIDNINQKKCIISWGIGILILTLLNLNHETDFNSIYNKNIETMRIILSKKNEKNESTVIQYITQEVEKIILNVKLLLKISDDNDIIIYIIRNTLCDYNKRITIDVILQKLYEGHPDYKHHSIYKNKYLKYKYKYLKEKYRLSS